MKQLMFLLVLPLLLIENSTTFANQPAPNQEDEWLITDRNRGSREKQTLYDYNRQNVQYNRRYNPDDYNDYYYNNSQDLDTFNRSYYQDNTSPDLYLNR